MNRKICFNESKIGNLKPDFQIETVELGKQHLKCRINILTILSLPIEVNRLILDFGSCHDLTVCEIKPHIRLCTDSTEPTWDSLSVPPLLTQLFLSFSQK